MMKNTLKIALLVSSFLLIGYGFYTILVPGDTLQQGPIEVEDQNNNTQSFAMIGLGILALAGGMALKKR